MAQDYVLELARWLTQAPQPGGAMKPERFRVLGASPLRLEGLETDILLEEGDDDFEVPSGVSAAPLSVGDTVWVLPELGADGRRVETWAALAVADGPAPGTGTGGGGGGGTMVAHTFEQPGAANPWVINHGLGRYPVGLQVYDHDGLEILADVRQPDLNTTTITFSGVMSGRATYA